MPTTKKSNDDNLDPEITDEELMLGEKDASDAPLAEDPEGDALEDPEEEEASTEEDPSEEMDSEEMTPEESSSAALPAGRSRLQTRLREKYPDEEYADDEAFYSRLADDYDDISTRLAARDEERDRLSKMMKADPRTANLISSMFRGEDPVSALVRQYGIEIRDIIDDPAMQDKIAEANKEYMERVAKSDELEDEYNSNLDESIRNAAELQEEMGLDDATLDKAFALLMTITNDAVVGKVSKDTLRMALKSISYDADVAKAGATGEIRGRNANIKAQLRKPTEGDGTVALNGAPGNASPRSNSIFDIAAMAR